MKSVVIGQYIPGTGFLYQLDPRTKILAVLFLMVAVFLLQTILDLVIALGIGILVLVSAKLSLGRIVKGLRPLFVLLAFTFVFQIAFNKEGVIWVDETLTFSIVSIAVALVWTFLWRMAAKKVSFKFLLFFVYAFGVYAIFRYLGYSYVFSTPQLVVYQGGVEMSVFVVIRLLIIITLSTVLTLTTKPTDLTQALESLMRPLKVIGIKPEEFALIISISLRYIPTILDEANKIMLAQASRGADFQEGKLGDKIRQVVSLLVPMFIIAFKRSEDLADAMESRDFVPGKPRTRLSELHFGGMDLVTFLFVAMAFAASILVRIL
jgi:energy-coupling factor transport system permease protein